MTELSPETWVVYDLNCNDIVELNDHEQLVFEVLADGNTIYLDELHEAISVEFSEGLGHDEMLTAVNGLAEHLNRDEDRLIITDLRAMKLNPLNLYWVQPSNEEMCDMREEATTPVEVIEIDPSEPVETALLTDDQLYTLAEILIGIKSASIMDLYELLKANLLDIAPDKRVSTVIQVALDALKRAGKDSEIQNIDSEYPMICILEDNLHFDGSQVFDRYRNAHNLTDLEAAIIRRLSNKDLLSLSSIFSNLGRNSKATKNDVRHAIQKLLEIPELITTGQTNKKVYGLNNLVRK